MGRKGGSLFLLPEAFRNPGGIERYNRDQVQAFRKCRPEEPVTILVLNDGPADLTRHEWDGCECRGFSGRKVAFALASFHAARRAAPARVILGHRHFLPLVSGLKASAPQTPIWLMLYGVEAWKRVSRLEKALLKGVSRAFAISPYTVRQSEAAGFPAPVELWPCGLPFDFRLPARVSPEMRSPARLLTVTRLSAAEGYKGVDHTLRALGALLRRGARAQLDVVGDGDDRPRLEALAEAEGVREQVRFRGRVSDAELREAYRTCDLFVLPSGGEGFGIAYLEAMAYGKPVIAADAAAAPFVVRPGESGYLVPFGDVEALTDRLGSLLGNPAEAVSMGATGRCFLEKSFTFERFVARCGEILSAEKGAAG